LLFLCTLLSLFLATAVLQAKPKAASVFEQGMAHYRRGEFTEAAAAFFRAYKLTPHADSLYNAALAWELAGEKATAATAYEMIKDDELHAEALADARSKLEKLAKELGRVEVEIPPGATVKVPPFAIEKTKTVFYFEPGTQTVKVSLSNGARVSRPVNAVAGETTVVVVTAVAGDDESEEASEEPDPAPDRKLDKKPQESAGGLTTLGWVSLGVAAAATGAAIFLGLETLSARDDYNASGHKDLAARDRAKSFMRWTNVAWVTAAITAGTGVGILLLAPKEGDSAAGVLLHGHF
jgi:hypothetical protein